MKNRIIKDQQVLFWLTDALYRCCLIFVLLVLTACFHEETSTTGNASNASTATINIKLSDTAVFLNKTGSQFQLSATLIDSTGVAFVEQPVFVWRSKASEIAEVDQTGLVTSMDFGQTQIIVSGGGVDQAASVLINGDISILTGKVRYADKEYNSSGFTGRNDYFKAVRFAQIDLVAANGQDVVASTFTDDAGNFTFATILSSQQTISVYATTDEAQGVKLQVKDRLGSLYAVSKSIDLSDLNNFAVDIPATSFAAGAFNILDVFTNAAQFTLENTSTRLVTLSAFWQPDKIISTYYCTGFDSSYCLQGPGVYVYSEKNADTDEFDDDVLYHEFGHYFTDILSRDDSLGGCHLLSSSDLDLRLAWSEGWGDYFPAGVKSWLGDPERKHLLSSAETLPLTAYVDTYAKSAQIYIDIVSLSQSRYNSAANEMAVAKILWSLSQQYDVPAIIKVLSEYFPTLPADQPVNLESFWDGWINKHAPNTEELTILEDLFAERLVFYRDDEYESDDDVDLVDGQRKAIFGLSETHYLYAPLKRAADLTIDKTQSNDRDIVAFDVESGKQYTLATSDLTGGADTNIQILDSLAKPLTIAGNVVENDDANANTYFSYDPVCGSSRIRNNGSALASKVTFIAPNTGTYYAEISTTKDNEPHLSAGRYGTYDFKISEN